MHVPQYKIMTLENYDLIEQKHLRLGMNQNDDDGRLKRHMKWVPKLCLKDLKCLTKREKLLPFLTEKPEMVQWWTKQKPENILP